MRTFTITKTETIEYSITMTEDEVREWVPGADDIDSTAIEAAIRVMSDDDSGPWTWQYSDFEEYVERNGYEEVQESTWAVREEE